MKQSRRLLIIFLTFAGLSISIAATSLWAAPEPAMECCGGPGECGPLQICCQAPPDQPCMPDEGKPYYCQSVCIWPGTGTSGY
jgi:hypothetical protein